MMREIEPVANALGVAMPVSLMRQMAGAAIELAEMTEVASAPGTLCSRTLPG